MADSKSKVRFIFVNGGPASGKDTQAELLAQKMPDSSVISPGGILRDLSTKHEESPYAPFFKLNTTNLRDTLRHGRNVNPKALTNGIVNLVNHELEEGRRNFIFAGYPREERSYWGITMYLENLRREGAYDAVKDQFVYLNVSEGELWKRFDERVQDAINDGREVRHDDLHGEFDERIKTFMQNTAPLIEDLLLDGKLITVDAMGPSEETQRELVWALGLQKITSVEGAAHNPQMRK